jgi:serine/threonine protein kinase
MYFAPAVDVWAIGVMAFILSTGEFPFESPSATMQIEYSWPACASNQVVREMIDSSVFVHSAQRASVTDLLDAGWLRRTKSVPQSINSFVLDRMETEFGFSKSLVSASLAAKSRNQITTTYHLLLHSMNM